MKRTDGLVKEVKKDLAEYIKIQEKEMTDLKERVDQIEADVDGLVNGSDHEEDEDDLAADDIHRDDVDSEHASKE